MIPVVRTRAAHGKKNTHSSFQARFFSGGYLQQAKDSTQKLLKPNKVKNQATALIEIQGGICLQKRVCCLQADKERSACTVFETIKYRGGDQFKTAAMYYRGYIHYSAGDFRSAIPLLEPLRDVPMYAPLASTYFLQSLFYLHEYEKVIQEGEKIYATADPALKINLAKILSESYFALNRHREARTFFDDYLTGVRELSRADRYYSGILHFKLGNYSQAAEQLAIAGETTDSLGQNALTIWEKPTLN
jgi:tetratricopeptide (TPR) repeat protein